MKARLLTALVVIAALSYSGMMFKAAIQPAIAQPAPPVSANQTQVGWSGSATVANTNRDGSGTVYEVIRVREDRQFLDRIVVSSLGTNAATVGAVIVSGPLGIADTSDNFMIGHVDLPATTAGTYAATDEQTISLDVWLPKGFTVYGLVHATQAAGRQFVAVSGSSYQ